MVDEEVDLVSFFFDAQVQVSFRHDTKRILRIDADSSLDVLLRKVVGDGVEGRRVVEGDEADFGTLVLDGVETVLNMLQGAVEDA